MRAAHRRSILKFSGKGFTLVELMISLAMISLASVLFGEAIIQNQKSYASIQTAATRNKLAFLLRRALVNRNAIKQTILNNPVMKAAVTGAPADYAAAGGIIYTDNRDYPVSIFDSSGSKLFGDGYPPVYYTIDGGQCTTPSVYNCLVSATGVVRIQGSAHWGTPSEMFPTPFYPSPASPTFKPAFMMLIGSFVFLPDANGQIIRRNPSSSSVFISLDDLGDLVP